MQYLFSCMIDRNINMRPLPLIRIEVCEGQSIGSRHSNDTIETFNELKATLLKSGIEVIKNKPYSYLSQLTDSWQQHRKWKDNRLNRLVSFPRSGSFQVLFKDILVFSKFLCGCLPPVAQVATLLVTMANIELQQPLLEYFEAHRINEVNWEASQRKPDNVLPLFDRLKSNSVELSNPNEIAMFMRRLKLSHSGSLASKSCRPYSVLGTRQRRNQISKIYCPQNIPAVPFKTVFTVAKPFVDRVNKISTATNKPHSATYESECFQLLQSSSLETKQFGKNTSSSKKKPIFGKGQKLYFPGFNEQAAISSVQAELIARPVSGRHGSNPKLTAGTMYQSRKNSREGMPEWLRKMKTDNKNFKIRKTQNNDDQADQSLKTESGSSKAERDQQDIKDSYSAKKDRFMLGIKLYEDDPDEIGQGQTSESLKAKQVQRQIEENILHELKQAAEDYGPDSYVYAGMEAVLSRISMNKPKESHEKIDTVVQTDSDPKVKHIKLEKLLSQQVTSCETQTEQNSIAFRSSFQATRLHEQVGKIVRSGSYEAQPLNQSQFDQVKEVESKSTFAQRVLNSSNSQSPKRNLSPFHPKAYQSPINNPYGLNQTTIECTSPILPNQSTVSTCKNQSILGPNHSFKMDQCIQPHPDIQPAELSSEVQIKSTHQISIQSNPSNPILPSLVGLKSSDSSNSKANGLQNEIKITCQAPTVLVHPAAISYSEQKIESVNTNTVQSLLIVEHAFVRKSILNAHQFNDYFDDSVWKDSKATQVGFNLEAPQSTRLTRTMNVFKIFEGLTLKLFPASNQLTLQKTNSLLAEVIKSIISSNSSQITRLFQNPKSINQQGVYCVWLADKKGVVSPVFVNDEFLVTADQQQPLYSGLQQNKSIWFMVLEKAVAKVYGSYHRLSRSSAGQLFRTLTYCPIVDLKALTTEKVAKVMGTETLLNHWCASVYTVSKSQKMERILGFLPDENDSKYSMIRFKSHSSVISSIRLQDYINEFRSLSFVFHQDGYFLNQVDMKSSSLTNPIYAVEIEAKWGSKCFVSVSNHGNHEALLDMTYRIVIFHEFRKDRFEYVGEIQKKGDFFFETTLSEGKNICLLSKCVVGEMESEVQESKVSSMTKDNNQTPTESALSLPSSLTFSLFSQQPLVISTVFPFTCSTLTKSKRPQIITQHHLDSTQLPTVISSLINSLSTILTSNHYAVLKRIEAQQQRAKVAGAAKKSRKKKYLRASPGRQRFKQDEIRQGDDSDNQRPVSKSPDNSWHVENIKVKISSYDEQHETSQSHIKNEPISGTGGDIEQQSIVEQEDKLNGQTGFKNIASELGQEVIRAQIQQQQLIKQQQLFQKDQNSQQKPQQSIQQQQNKQTQISHQIVKTQAMPHQVKQLFQNKTAVIFDNQEDDAQIN